MATAMEHAKSLAGALTKRGIGHAMLVEGNRPTLSWTLDERNAPSVDFRVTFDWGGTIFNFLGGMVLDGPGVKVAHVVTGPLMQGNEENALRLMEACNDANWNNCYHMQDCPRFYVNEDFGVVYDEDVFLGRFADGEGLLRTMLDSVARSSVAWAYQNIFSQCLEESWVSWAEKSVERGRQ